MAKTKGKRVGGELYWPFECEQGHKWDLGPIHDPDGANHENYEGGIRSVPGSGRDEHVPDEVFCPHCFNEAGATVKAHPAK